MTEKGKIINRITEITNLYGRFGIADVEADSSPILFDKYGVTIFVEYFGYTKGIIRTYVNNGLDVHEEDVDYSDMPIETLKEILELAEKWKEISEDE